MKLFVSLIALVFSVNAFAADAYECTLQDAQATLTIEKKGDDKVKVTGGGLEFECDATTDEQNLLFFNQQFEEAAGGEMDAELIVFCSGAVVGDDTYFAISKKDIMPGYNGVEISPVVGPTDVAVCTAK